MMWQKSTALFMFIMVIFCAVLSSISLRSLKEGFDTETETVAVAATSILSNPKLFSLLQHVSCIQIPVQSWDSAIEDLKAVSLDYIYLLETGGIEIMIDRIRQSCRNNPKISETSAIAVLLTQSVYYIDKNLEKPVLLDNASIDDYTYSDHLLQTSETTGDIPIMAHIFILKQTDEFSTSIQKYYSSAALCATICKNMGKNVDIQCGCKNSTQSRCLTNPEKTDYNQIEKPANFDNYANLYNVNIRSLFIGL